MTPVLQDYHFRVTSAAGKFIMELLAARPYGEVAALIADLTKQALEQEAAWATGSARAPGGETATDVSRETSLAPARPPARTAEEEPYDSTKPPAPVREATPLIPPKGGPVVAPIRPPGPATSLRAR